VTPTMDFDEYEPTSDDLAAFDAFEKQRTLGSPAARTASVAPTRSSGNASSLRTLHSDTANPLCICGNPSVVKRVLKEDANRGRSFRACATGKTSHINLTKPATARAGTYVHASTRPHEPCSLARSEHAHVRGHTAEPAATPPSLTVALLIASIVTGHRPEDE
jgi:hypothetical protein